MKIIYDDIIFSLQRAGGISELWSNVSTQQEKALHLIYDNAKENIAFKTNLNHEYKFLSSKFIWGKRYLNISTKESLPFIFHSSYYRFAKDKRAINVTTVHDFMYEIYRKDCQSYLHKIQKRKAIINSDGIICISENTKKDLNKYCPNTKGKIRVIYNGFNDTAYHFKNSPREKILVYVGGRKDYKDFSLAVSIAKEMNKYQFIIVGGGDLSKEELMMLKGIPYTKIGYATNDQLCDLYNKSFALLYPSEYEGFGITPIEAQACGCLVLCQNKSSLPEVVADTAIFIDPQTIEKTLATIKQYEDPVYYNKLQTKGLINAKRFSWTKCAKEYYDFYVELWKEKGYGHIHQSIE